MPSRSSTRATRSRTWSCSSSGSARSGPRSSCFCPASATGSTSRSAFWLWFTCLFANFAEAMAEGRGKAHADALRKMRTKTTARKLVNGKEVQVASSELKVGDRFVCEAGDFIAADGEIVEGIATVDESAITGESAPVVRESGGDRSAVTGGTQVIERPDRRAGHRRGGQLLPRPDDRDDRGRPPPEDPERNRAQHRPGQPDGAVHRRGLHAAAVCPLQRGAGRAEGRCPDDDPRAALADCLPDSDHHRRPAERHRHRRH